MTDKTLVEQLAAVMARAFRDYTGSKPGDNMWNLDMERTFEIVAPAAEKWLAEQGRLVPDGALSQEQWGYELTYSQGQVRFRELAVGERGGERLARSTAASTANWDPPGAPGVVKRRTVVTFATPWVVASAKEDTDG